MGSKPTADAGSCYPRTTPLCPSPPTPTTQMLFGRLQSIFCHRLRPIKRVGCPTWLPKQVLDQRAGVRSSIKGDATGNRTFGAAEGDQPHARKDWQHQLPPKLQELGMVRPGSGTKGLPIPVVTCPVEGGSQAWVQPGREERRFAFPKLFLQK